MAAISGFFGGRGETMILMWVNIIATGVNVVLDYLLIFGYAGMPELGMQGAAIATVIANWAGAIILFYWMLRPKFRLAYGTHRNRQFRPALFKRLMRFGLPNGGQILLDLLGFTLFILFVGRFGTSALAATNIAFNINSIAFMPMIGVGIAVEIIVGQYLGDNNPKMARYSTYSAFHLTCLYMGLMALSYVLIPSLFIYPFSMHSDPQQFGEVREMAIVLLRFVALYSLFDTMNIIFANALKGAGDTRQVMKICVVLSWVTMIIPSYFSSVVYNWGVYVTWCFVTLYITLLGIVFYLRFLQGKCESMRVIEEVPFTLPPNLPENPAG
jgi:MATE family multidrug resistance protein